MAQNLRKRKEKIEIIQGIMTGRIGLQSISDRPEVFFLEIVHLEGTPSNYYAAGKEVTKEEYEALKKAHSRKGSIVWEEEKDY